MSGKTPLELLQPDDRIEPFVNQYWGGILGGVLGATTAGLSNTFYRKPFFSGIQRHVTYALVVGVALNYVNNYRVAYYAERDAVFRHYVELHPEDFITKERKKYADVLEPWIPIR